jgi:lipoyl(octanoyl) transferase
LSFSISSKSNLVFDDKPLRLKKPLEAAIMPNQLRIRELGRQDYLSTWEKMKSFTDDRHEHTLDEVWLLEHSPVFTQGQAGKPEHILHPGNIPVVQTDRGGQVTYHGPGQLVMYVLFDLRRRKMSIRQLVTNLEQTVISLLSQYQVSSRSQCAAPGVYVEAAKICSIGLRVRKGCSYHGIAFNIDMDLEPFSRINPCGFQNLTVTQLSHYCPNINLAEIEDKIVSALLPVFGYNKALFL